VFSCRWLMVDGKAEGGLPVSYCSGSNAEPPSNPKKTFYIRVRCRLQMAPATGAIVFRV